VGFAWYFFVLCFAALSLSAWIGASFARRQPVLEESEHQDCGVIVTAALTLLALMIGFSFSMAAYRYDQRKHNEAAEASAIGAEYLRAGLLPAASAARARILLKSYLTQRILFYNTWDANQIKRINAATAQLQNNLWSTVQDPAMTQPTAVAAFILSGMNEVLNSQSNTQAAWWDRLPTGAWVLMVVIGVLCNLLFGYNSHPGSRKLLFLGLPLVVSVAFVLLDEMDSPRTGLVRVHPQNLEVLSISLGTR
jgi:hypothetical protein